jgi:succinate dehydrogenase/fumarate reductase flavoprotein subunit
VNEQQSNNGSARPGGNGFLGGFVAGAIAGAILAYVILQEDARDMIVGKAREAGNRAMDATGDLRELYQRGRDVVDSARSQIDDDLTRKASET